MTTTTESEFQMSFRTPQWSWEMGWDEVVASSSPPQPTATSNDITYSQMSLNVNFCSKKLWTFPSIHTSVTELQTNTIQEFSTVCGMLRTRKSRKTGLRSRMAWHSHPRRHSRHSNKKRLKQKAIIFRSKHWLFVRSAETFWIYYKFVVGEIYVLHLIAHRSKSNKEEAKRDSFSPSSRRALR